ncbi:hypothetical protein ADUPG1_013504 [Aduncisulcus paluster]|uniref:Uncharacterized protein n=1 Tax=Aduncisulcus paluster TaxID=2918883 RepID=A0ABQ5K3R7_9EUKA|nr:hypothetical protein ADUPG1_013504 [Aduncisulcus paluster]
MSEYFPSPRIHNQDSLEESRPKGSADISKSQEIYDSAAGLGSLPSQETIASFEDRGEVILSESSEDEIEQESGRIPFQEEISGEKQSEKEIEKMTQSLIPIISPHVPSSESDSAHLSESKMSEEWREESVPKDLHLSTKLPEGVISKSFPKPSRNSAHYFPRYPLVPLELNPMFPTSKLRPTDSYKSEWNIEASITDHDVISRRLALCYIYVQKKLHDRDLERLQTEKASIKLDKKSSPDIKAKEEEEEDHPSIPIDSSSPLCPSSSSAPIILYSEDKICEDKDFWKEDPEFFAEYSNIVDKFKSIVSRLSPSAPIIISPEARFSLGLPVIIGGKKITRPSWAEDLFQCVLKGHEVI